MHVFIRRWLYTIIITKTLRCFLTVCLSFYILNAYVCMVPIISDSLTGAILYERHVYNTSHHIWIFFLFFPRGYIMMI